MTAAPRNTLRHAFHEGQAIASRGPRQGRENKCAFEGFDCRDGFTALAQGERLSEMSES